MPFHTNRNNKSQRTRWLENFYPKFGARTRELIEGGFNQRQVSPPMAIYFPSDASKTREEILQDIIDKVTGGGGGTPPVGPEPTISSTDSGGDSTSVTPIPTSTGGGGTTGTGGSGTGISTSGDYATSGGVPTDEGSTTGGGGTTMTSGGGVDTGITTGGSGTIIVIPPDPPIVPPPTSGSGTSDTGYDTDCSHCKLAAADTMNNYDSTCGVAYEGTDANGYPISVPWSWSECFEPEIIYYNSVVVWTTPATCVDGESKCPLMIVNVDDVRTLCGCAIAYGCGTVADANCTNPGPPGLSCNVGFACCYQVVPVLPSSTSCVIVPTTGGPIYDKASTWPCNRCDV